MNRKIGEVASVKEKILVYYFKFNNSIAMLSCLIEFCGDLFIISTSMCLSWKNAG